MKQILKKVSLLVASLFILGAGSAMAAPAKAKVTSKEAPGVTLYKAGEYVKAKPLLEIECKANKSLSCYNLASMLDFGSGNTKKDPQTAVTIYDKACTLGNADACGSLADLYALGSEFVPIDTAEADKFYKQSCDIDKEYGKNCTIAGDAYFFGDTMNKDVAKAADFYEKGCAKKDGLGCLYLADVYLYGYLGAVDYDKAHKYYKIGCDLKTYKSCFELGIMYENGEGRPVDKDLAFDYYKTACDNKNADGCFGMGILSYNGTPKHPLNYTSAFSFFKLACDGSSADGCFGIAHMYYSGNAGEKNMVLAKEYLGKALKINPNHEKSLNLQKMIG